MPVGEAEGEGEALGQGEREVLLRAVGVEEGQGERERRVLVETLGVEEGVGAREVAMGLLLETSVAEAMGERETLGLGVVWRVRLGVVDVVESGELVPTALRVGRVDGVAGREAEALGQEDGVEVVLPPPSPPMAEAVGKSGEGEGEEEAQGDAEGLWVDTLEVEIE